MMNSHKHKSEFESLSNVLQEKSPWYDGIQQGLREREDLNAHWEKLPLEISRFGKIAKYEAGKLTLMADNAAYASRLLLMKDEIQQQLKKNPIFNDLKTITAIVVPVSENALPKAENKTSATSLSENAKENLRSTAKHIKDPKLKAALEKLAR